jgi:hypothetical protein
MALTLSSGCDELIPPSGSTRDQHVIDTSGAGSLAAGRTGQLGGITVDYVALLSFRSSLSAAERDGALMRRTAWQYPEGIRPIAEYWPAAAAYQVVTIFSADSFDKVMEVLFEWNDVFDIDIHPAVSADEGLKIGPEVFGRLPRMQQS